MSDYTIPTEVSSNPSLVEFPTDQDGMFSKLIQAGMLAAQKVYCQDQLDKLMCMYGILIKHSRACAEASMADVAAHVAATMKADAEAAALIEQEQAVDSEFSL